MSKKRILSMYYPASSLWLKDYRQMFIHKYVTVLEQRVVDKRKLLFEYKPIRVKVIEVLYANDYHKSSGYSYMCFSECMKTIPFKGEDYEKILNDINNTVQDG